MPWPITAWSESMGRVGSSGDNAAMDSFFALLQKNVLDRRRQARLGRLTPTEFETIMNTTVTLAA